MILRRRWFQVRALAAGRERSAVRQMVVAGVGAFFLLAACKIPSVPDGPTRDAFDGAVINCQLPEVENESFSLITPVRRCLVGDVTSACLLDLTNSYHVDSVACEVRLQGVQANRKVLAQQPGPDDVTVDEAARQWIRQKGIGYR